MKPAPSPPLPPAAPRTPSRRIGLVRHRRQALSAESKGVSFGQGGPVRRSLLSSEGGFTLIELLVVIVIIGVLAGLLLPVLARTRDKANMARCTANLRNLGQAIVLYADDAGGFLPPLSDASGATWDSKILPYLSRSQAVFLCPSDPWPHADPTTPPRSYAANGGVAYPPYVATELPFGGFAANPVHRLENVAGASNRLILIGERPGDAATNRGLVGAFGFCSLDTIPGTVHQNGRGAMYLFADTGVEYLNLEQAIYGVNNYWYLQ